MLRVALAEWARPSPPSCRFWPAGRSFQNSWPPLLQAPPSSFSPISPTPPPSPSASATPPSARRRATSTRRSAPPFASMQVRRSKARLLGDGVLAVFTSARQAIEAALVCGRAGGDAGLPLHLG